MLWILRPPCRRSTTSASGSCFHEGSVGAVDVEASDSTSVLRLSPSVCAGCVIFLTQSHI